MSKDEKTLPEQAHDAMHKIPGMPEHGEAEQLNSHGGLPHQPLQNRPFENKPLQSAHTHFNHADRDPKVLVGWQQKIAKFFNAEKK